jgi:hypothetical protein
MEQLQWVKGEEKGFMLDVEDVEEFLSIRERVTVLHVDLDGVQNSEAIDG